MYNTGTEGPTPGTGRSRYVRKQIQHLGQVGQGMYNINCVDVQRQNVANNVERAKFQGTVIK